MRNRAKEGQNINYQEKNLTDNKELSDTARLGRTYCDLRNPYQGIGNFKQANKYQEYNLGIAKVVGDRAAEEGAAYCNLGNAYQGHGDFKQAIKYHMQHLSILKESGE